MNTELLDHLGRATRRRDRRERRSRRGSVEVTYRAGTSGDAPALHALIAAHLEEGHLLPRDLGELAVHAPRFVVAVRNASVVGCAELAPLSERVAEIRSLVVDRQERAGGIGSALVSDVKRRADVAGFERLCAFTHDAGYFLRLGFSIVPHASVPEKIALDCQRCPQFGHCGQHAVVLPLGTGRSSMTQSRTFVRLASLRS